MSLKLVQRIVIMVLVSIGILGISGCDKGDLSADLGEIVDGEYLLTASLAVYRDEDYIQEIINIDTNTGEPTLIAANEEMYAAPLWSPDGTQLAHSSLRENGKQFICIVDSDGNELKSLPNLGGDEAVIGWSRDGDKLLIQVLLEEEIPYHVFYIVDIESGEADLVGDFREDGFESIQYAQWSPDESHVVFAAADGSGKSSIYKYDLENGLLTDMTQGYYDDTPKWSPDGKYILFTRLREGSSLKAEEGGYNPSIDIWLTDLEGTEFKCIAKDELVDHLDPCWSPDGKSIVFVRSPKDIEAENQLVIYNIESGEEKILNKGREYMYIPAVSPDGKSVAIASFDTDEDKEMSEEGFESNIYTIDIDKGSVTKLTTFIGDIYTLEWGRQGSGN